MKKRLKKENNIVIDKIILLMSVENVLSKLLLGKKRPDDIIVIEYDIDYDIDYNVDYNINLNIDYKIDK